MKVSKEIIIFIKNIEVGKEKIKIIFKPASTLDELVVSKGKDHLVVTVGGSKRFYEILELLRKNFEAFRKHNSFYFYVNQVFPVYPNAYLRDIYENFGSKEGNEKLITLHYSSIEAWG